ncbi:NAD(P)-dependent oxidoreductase [Actinophytocola sp.]|uniref:NAD(P)-dependent oxidoreductase n=1 Tax=Actinophytocola sp. TaxID=1872138 RepID=UPI002D7FAADC|nr:NAD(P)-dependent oxidoreductase [Actinophytocola sp.]HET9142421.1 NAD(P)-dependent oxidoreductase [Actinophytocola sp.]
MIAFIGLGHMGAPMARRLLSAGAELVVWNRTRSRAVPLAGAGARIADTPAAAAAGADIVITMLSGPPAVESVLFGPDGVLSAPGSRCLVEMSTIGPAAVHGIAARLPAGVSLVDAPVAGGVRQAEAGALRILAGGDAPDLERVAPALAPLGTVLRCGGVGSGASAKMVANTALIGGMALLAEILELAGLLALPQTLTLDVLSHGPLASLLDRAQAPGGHFTLALAAKDLTLALTSPASGLPVTTAAHATLQTAAAHNPGHDLRTLTNLTAPQPR